MALVAGTFGAAPNPVQSELALSFDARVVGTGQLRVADMLGRTVLTRAVSVRTGANSLAVALPDITPGIYLLTLEVGDARLTTRLAKE